MWICLAGSMTAGAALLSWLEPRHGQVPMNGSAPVFSERARTAIAKHRQPLCGWNMVQLVTLTDGPSPATLTAVPPRNDLHFVVTSAGGVTAETAWDQQSYTDKPGCIYIGVQESCNDGRTMQEACLKSLLQELHDATTATQTNVSLRPFAVSRSGPLGA